MQNNTAATTSSNHHQRPQRRSKLRDLILASGMKRRNQDCFGNERAKNQRTDRNKGAAVNSQGVPERTANTAPPLLAVTMFAQNEPTSGTRHSSEQWGSLASPAAPTTVPHTNSFRHSLLFQRRPSKQSSSTKEEGYPLQARQHSTSVPRSIDHPSTMQFQHQVIGDPSLRIFRLRLPPHLFHLLDSIVLGCEAHAATLPRGWCTDLYTLTAQDIALRDIPYLYDAAKPITSYMKHAIAVLMGVPMIRTDRNQPHVLRYSAVEGHTGVELHHDKCDVTANLCLSRGTSYVGGGTFFPDVGKVVRLELGEFLIHPGALVHAGMHILSGTRHLMVLFANVK